MLGDRLVSFFRRLQKGPPVPSVIGMAWYKEEEWPLLLAASVDAARMEKTYTEWLAFAQVRYDALVQKGTPVEKVIMNVNDMVKWCHEMGQKVDGQGRSAYVAYQLENKKAAQLGIALNRAP